MAVLGARGSIEVAGISTWEIRDTGTDQTWYTIPFLRDVKVTEEDLFKPDTNGRPRPYARKFQVTGKMMATGSATNCLGILDNIANQMLDVKVTSKSGTIWDSKGATGAGAGLKWKLVSEGDMENDRYLEITMDRRYLISESDAFHTAQTNVETGTDAELAKLESIVASDIVPAGVQAIAFGDGNTTDYTVTLSGNNKFTAETLAKTDQYGRSNSYQVQVNFESDILGTDESVEIPAMDTISRISDLRLALTMADGRIFTSGSTLGVNLELVNGADSDDIQTLKLKMAGRMTLTAFAAAWS